jgi:preprotein translocase subunit SecG
MHAISQLSMLILQLQALILLLCIHLVHCCCCCSGYVLVKEAYGGGSGRLGGDSASLTHIFSARELAAQVLQLIISLLIATRVVVQYSRAHV